MSTHYRERFMCGNHFYSVANISRALRHSLFNEMLLIWGILIFTKEQMNTILFKWAKKKKKKKIPICKSTEHLSQITQSWPQNYYL